MVKWGVIATIKAEVPAIMRFVAHHLELGAHRVYVYLDTPNPEAQQLLRDHPRCRVVRCDDGYWKRHNGSRPDMHQPRQTFNATRAYHRALEVDWLMHMDVDEFLVSDVQIGNLLGTLPDTVQCARARPMELLAGGDPMHEAAFKTFIPAGKERERTVAALYPTFGDHLKGGFLSHIAGKIFVRTGIDDLKIRIHNAFLHGETNPNHVELPELHLAHFHATDWETWHAHFAYRHQSGSYRESLGPSRSRSRGGISMHELFAMLYKDGGEASLRMFFDEVCADTPALRARLQAQGHLKCSSFAFDTNVAKHFPDIASI